MTQLQTLRQTNRQADRQAGRQTDRQTDKKTDRQTDRFIRSLRATCHFLSIETLKQGLSALLLSPIFPNFTPENVVHQGKYRALV